MIKLIRPVIPIWRWPRYDKRPVISRISVMWFIIWSREQQCSRAISERSLNITLPLDEEEGNITDITLLHFTRYHYQLNIFTLIVASSVLRNECRTGLSPNLLRKSVKIFVTGMKNGDWKISGFQHHDSVHFGKADAVLNIALLPLIIIIRMINGIDGSVLR